MSCARPLLLRGAGDGERDCGGSDFGEMVPGTEGSGLGDTDRLDRDGL